MQQVWSTIALGRKTWIEILHWLYKERRKKKVCSEGRNKTSQKRMSTSSCEELINVTIYLSKIKAQYVEHRNTLLIALRQTYKSKPCSEDKWNLSLFHNILFKIFLLSWTTKTVKNILGICPRNSKNWPIFDKSSGTFSVH